MNSASLPSISAEELRRRTREVLLKVRPLVLVGLMGAGKSSLGRAIAPHLGAPFLDTDAEIESSAGMSVGDIFAQQGEAAFRIGERAVIQRLVDGHVCMVLATGGGAFVDPETQSLLNDRGLTVWLDADLETIWKRVSRKQTRPLLRTDDPRGTLERLARERAPSYAQAHLKLETDDGPIEFGANKLLNHLRHIADM